MDNANRISDIFNGPQYFDKLDTSQRENKNKNMVFSYYLE